MPDHSSVFQSVISQVVVDQRSFVRLGRRDDVGTRWYEEGGTRGRTALGVVDEAGDFETRSVTSVTWSQKRGVLMYDEQRLQCVLEVWGDELIAIAAKPTGDTSVMRMPPA